jgi:hypothetical protein
MSTCGGCTPRVSSARRRGKDILAEGVAYDTFVFNTAPSHDQCRLDHRLHAVQDTIWPESAMIPGLGSHLGTLYAANFWKSTTGHTTTAITATLRD